jgi:hypothetical protein
MNKKYKYHCIYCGNKNQIERDHIIPKSWSYNYSFLNTDSNPLVPACKECNKTLSNVPKHTAEDRADYLIIQYEKKWKKVLNLPDWTSSEIEELGPSLQKSLRKSLREKEMKKLRLENLYKFRSTPFYDYI